MNYLSEAPQRQPRAWCYGGGVDSTAGIIQDINRGVQIDLITMADHGGEKQGTYDFLPIFSDWIHERIGLRPELCKYEPMEKTSEKYLTAASGLIDQLGLSLPPGRVEQLGRGIFGNMIANETLPGICFQRKSCSVKWKLEAQEPI